MSLENAHAPLGFLSESTTTIPVGNSRKIAT